MAADPFDPWHAFPYYPSTSTAEPWRPTYAIYPLIYSAGPDGNYGVVAELAETSSIYPLTYTSLTIQVNPFYAKTPGGSDPPFHLIGTQKQVGNEPEKGWVDNIHNHLTGLR
jgi:hypothetical protein